jgi:hypothetical protein
MTHLQAERETVERLRRQLEERRSLRDVFGDLSSDAMAAETSGPREYYIPDDSVSIDWTSLGQHNDWTG